MSRYQQLMSQEFYEAAKDFTVNPESCENPKHYEDYLKFSAISENNSGTGTTHIFIDEEFNSELHIMGYITLRCSSLIKDMGESHKFGYPALEISELAVDARYERQGIGTDMVSYAISLAEELNLFNIGIKYLILCSDPSSVKFYSSRKLGLKEIYPHEEIPREQVNLQCVPMYLNLVEKRYII